MYITTNVPIKDYVRIGAIWHGDFDPQYGKGAVNLVSHGITRSLIGHPVPENATAGINILQAVTDNAETVSGTIIFLNL